MSKKIAKALGASRSLSVALELSRVKDQLADYKRLFEHQHERSRQAEILWREHTGKPNVSPDLGALLDWLIMRGDRWQGIVAAARHMREKFVLADVKQMPELADLRKALDSHDMFYEGIKL